MPNICFWHGPSSRKFWLMKTPFRLAALAAAFLTFAPSLAHAYFVASLTGTVIDTGKPTHLLVSGRGQNLGRQPQLSALGVAARIHQANPDDQIVLISVFEDATNRTDLEAKGVTITTVNESVPFNTSSSMPELTKFKQIASLQFFGHNSPSLGTQTDGPGERFDFREKKVLALRKHFTNDGYIFIHGCNAGWTIAPMLSKSLGVPVAGALTGTNFERLNADGNFYVADASHIPNKNWAQSNASSFAKDRLCANGGCLRMRPENHAYKGHWGDLTAGGLGFYKFFCETVTQAQCERVMAKALFNFLTIKTLSAASTRESFIAGAKDFICPPSKDRVVSEQCERELDAAVAQNKSTGYSSLGAGPAVQCDFKSCEVKFVCTTTGGIAGIGECSVQNLAKAPAHTQVDEFLAYVRGFDSLSR